MSRAIWMSVAMVFGCRFAVSIAQAASVLATKPAPTTKVAPAAMPRDRSWRRVRPGLGPRLGPRLGPVGWPCGWRDCWLFGVMSCLLPRALVRRLFEATAALKHFDLVSVRVRHEEEFAHQLPIWGEFDDLAGGEAFGLETGVLGLEILDEHGQMAIAIAKVIRLGAALVHGQLDLERGFVIAEVNQREVAEIEPVGDFEPKGAAVKINRSRLVENADHAVDGFGHEILRIVNWSGKFAKAGDGAGSKRLLHRENGHSAAIRAPGAGRSRSRCTRQVQRRRAVKFFGSPFSSSTSPCSLETKAGVDRPSPSAISSRMAQKDFSSRMLVLWPFRRIRRVSSS